MDIILASASPRRRELLGIITKSFTAVSTDADESLIEGEEPTALVMRLARLKAEAAASGRHEQYVIGCDTVVDLNGRVLGKPRDEREALEMLSALSGKMHLVHTGVCILKGGNCVNFCETTAVTFAEIPEKELLLYIKTDEPYDKAGGYGIQAWAAKFITKTDGCFFNVMGFPVAAVYKALTDLDNAKL